MPRASLRCSRAATIEGEPAPYIYSILPVHSALAAISSDDSLRLFDPQSLNAVPKAVFRRVHEGVTGLARFDESGHTIATCGRDGLIKCWDTRNGKNVLEFGKGTDTSTPRGSPADLALAINPRSSTGSPVLSLDCQPGSHGLAYGSELTDRRAVVSVWSVCNSTSRCAPRVGAPCTDIDRDIRSTKSPRVLYADSHNDDVTEVCMRAVFSASSNEPYGSTQS